MNESTTVGRMTKQIKILIADDHPVFRAGLRQVLLADPTLEIVHETGDGAEALRWARELKPDIAVLDLDMPGMHGLEIARVRQRERLPFEIVFLTTYREEDMFDEAVKKLGAKGYVIKESAAADILQSIHAVADGRHYISPALAGILLKPQVPSALDRLTPAERRILRLIASDKTSKEIADELGLSPRTVENHRTNMSAKLGLQGSHSLLKFAFDHRPRL